MHLVRWNFISNFAVMEFIVESPSGLSEVARAFIPLLSERRIWALEGAMGAGKTTFVSEVCRQLEVEEEAASPTFSIINEYRSQKLGEPLYHFDFYRIDSEEEALDIGLDDYLESGYPCLMEWSEKVAGLLPDTTSTVRIEELPDGSRKFTID